MESKFSEMPDGSRILDIGSGPSPFRDLTTRFNLTSVDWEKHELVDEIADLNKSLPFESDSFDVVLSTNTFEHLYNPKEVIKECHRVLRGRGALVGAVPFLLQTHQEPYDYFRYTNFALKQMMEDVGFEVLDIKPLGVPFDVVKQTQLHFFMKLFSAKRHSLLVKLSWNFLKLFNKLISHFLKLDAENQMCLGYGFYAKKKQ